MADQLPMDRVFSHFGKTFNSWMNREVQDKSAPAEVLDAWLQYVAFETAHILVSNVKPQDLGNAAAVSTVNFLDFLRQAIESRIRLDARDGAMGRGNGNGADSDPS